MFIMYLEALIETPLKSTGYIKVPVEFDFRTNKFYLSLCDKTLSGKTVKDLLSTMTTETGIVFLEKNVEDTCFTSFQAKL